MAACYKTLYMHSWNTDSKTLHFNESEHTSSFSAVGYYHSKHITHWFNRTNQTYNSSLGWAKNMCILNGSCRGRQLTTAPYKKQKVGSYMALAWWLVPCLPFPGLPHIYFLFTVRLTNERVGIFLTRRSKFSLQQTWKILSRTVNRK
jgi:hypothetical protein